MALRIHKVQGQMVMAEYVMIFFLAIGAIIAMSTFVQRALQARIRDADRYMINQVSAAHGNQIAREYEPYYGNVQTLSTQDSTDTTQYVAAPGTGIFRKILNEQTKVQSKSQQAPPKQAQ